MLGYKRPCRNGPGCRFLATGNCWFYHPQSHMNNPWHNNNHYEHEDSNEDEDDYRHYQFLNHREKQQKQQQSVQYVMNLIRRMRLEGFDNVVNGVNEEKKVRVGGREVVAVPVVSDLPVSRKWFFEKSRHFRHFQQSEFHQCSICLQNYQKDATISALFCNHAFHTPCISNWLKTSDNCPMCRKDFRTHKEFQSMPGYAPPQKEISAYFNPYISTMDVDFDQDDDSGSYLDSDNPYEDQFDYDFGIDIDDD